MAEYRPSPTGWVRRQVDAIEAAAFPPYADYVITAAEAGRRIPVFVLERD